MIRNERFFVLGISSWIGHHLVAAIKDRCPNAKIIGVARREGWFGADQCHPLENARHDEIIHALTDAQPTVLINLARGEDDTAFKLHEKLIHACNIAGIFYAYASSSNACDAEAFCAKTEDAPPAAASDYGRFKARCEQALAANSQNYSIYRFAATHGWAPNRTARTESFLDKLCAGEDLEIPKGVIQNRTAVSDLAQMMVALAGQRIKGVCHLGTTDSSEEYEFLKRLAEEFGHPADSVKLVGEHTANMTMIPGKILQHFGDEFRKTEEDTIRNVGKVAELQKYRRASTKIHL